ncbi:hypothetical protein WJX84_002262 [Apatococcus fuscideae]|uniref:Uncharacterized protein n=1 Tax=Apatococcus fuscideae TaxID=2026836 RepID=A0AAW1T3A2_9CHLO
MATSARGAAHENASQTTASRPLRHQQAIAHSGVGVRLSGGLGRRWENCRGCPVETSTISWEQPVSRLDHGREAPAI